MDGTATAELPRFARVTFFVAKKVTKENSQYLGKSAIGKLAGIFRCGILPRRKTAHVLCAALRVYDSLTAVIPSCRRGTCLSLSKM